MNPVSISGKTAGPEEGSEAARKFTGDLKEVSKHFTIFGIGRVLEKIIGFLLIPLYTVYFSKADFGVMELLSLFTMIGGLLMSFGISNAVLRFYFSAEDERERSLHVSTALTYYIAVSAVLSLAFAIFRRQVSVALLGTPAYASLVPIVSLSFFFTCSADVAWMYLRARAASGKFVALTQVASVVTLSTILYLVVHRKMGIAGAFWGSVVGNGLLAIILVTMTVRKVGFGFSPTILRKLARFGTPIMLIGIAGFVLNFSDRFFLEKFANLDEVGLYSLAYKFGFIMSILLVQPFQLTWETQSYALAAQGRDRQVFPRVFCLFSAVLITAAFLMSLYIREVFDIMVDAKFRMAWQFVPLVAFGYVAQGMGRFWEAGLLIKDRSALLGRIGVLGTLVCLVLNAALISTLTTWGACIATLVGFIVLAAVTYRTSRKLHRIDVNVGPIAVVIAVAVVLLVIAFALPIASWWLRMAAKTAIAAVYMIAVYKSGILPDDVRHHLGSRILGLLKGRSVLDAVVTETE